MSHVCDKVTVDPRCAVRNARTTSGRTRDSRRSATGERPMAADVTLREFRLPPAPARSSLMPASINDLIPLKPLHLCIANYNAMHRTPNML